MRVRMAHIGLWVWLLMVQQFVHAQNSNEMLQRADTCLVSTILDETPSGREITIHDVTLSGFIQLPVVDQDEIVATIKRRKYSAPLDPVLEDAMERVKAEWQNRGYFKVEVTGNAKTTGQNTNGFQIALFVNVDENIQYRLGGISFKNNRAIQNVKALREFFPIKDGEIFSREQIAKGLENLRKAYGEFGYVSFTAVPATTFDDAKKLAYLQVDIDEGKQFYVADIKIEGVDQTTQQNLSKALAIKPGAIYNGRLFDLSRSRMVSLYPACECRPAQRLQLDESNGYLVVTLDFSPCPAM